MKILLISSFLPYPLFSGGHIRLYNLMKNLKKNGHTVTLICEKRDYQSDSDVKKVSEVCEKVITIPRKKQWTLKNIVSAGFSKSSFLSVGHKLPEMKELIRKELNEKKYDLIHVETFYVNQNLPKTSLPVVLAEHNIEYFVYKRFSHKAPFILKPLFFLDVLKMKEEERGFWKKATKLVAVSASDKKEMKREDVFIVPNGVDIEKFNLKRNYEKEEGALRKLLFIGDFKWIQNKDALSFILKEVWPNLTKEALENNLKVKLWVVGKRIPQELKDLGDKDVLFDENAPVETEKIYNEADLLISPIRVGGGTNFKILESMASGLPVLTTNLGNEGIDAKNNEEIVIAEEAKDYIFLSLKLLKDPKLYKEISQNSKAYIRGKFDWVNITKKLEDVYKEATS